jgi:glycine cleavage system transcriptional repressor
VIEEDRIVKKWIISAIGKDQPGIVAAFTEALFETHCNVEDTSMTLLEDHFTMLFIIHAPADLTLDALEQRLKKDLGDYHLQLALHAIETEEETPEATGRPWMISVSGPDQTGIIYHVTQYLASARINIRHLSSKRLSRSTGETLFLMALEVDVPSAITDEAMQEALAKVAQDEQLEIHAEALEVYTL